MFLLILFTGFWTTSSVNYYLIVFLLKYIPGNLYVNTTVSALAEIIANITSGFIVKMIGIKYSYIVAYVIATLGGLCMTFFFNVSSAMAVFVLLSKFGIAFAFNTAYLTTPMVFPVILTSTAFGICNVVARFSTIASPIVAELSDPIPMVAFLVVSIIGLVCSFFAPNKKHEEN